jgi:hypothetical protein
MREKHGVRQRSYRYLADLDEGERAARQRESDRNRQRNYRQRMKDGRERMNHVLSPLQKHNRRKNTSI